VDDVKLWVVMNDLSPICLCILLECAFGRTFHFLIHAWLVVTLECESLVTPERIRVCAFDRTFRGILALVTWADFLICALLVVTLECESLVILERIRVCALDRTFWGVIALVTLVDFLIRALQVVTL
jgi:hypothetical protein